MSSESTSGLQRPLKPLASSQAHTGQIGGPGAAPAVAPTFFVRDVPVYGDVVLAPMAGFADVPTRTICRRFGSTMNYSEFVAAEDIIHGTSRAMSLLDFTADDRP
ncbi:MAG TPA: tRNA-dihydrouridine synthase, partial [Anaerolineae bacterium]|nr:tRNA-dihydrouridine synthase [Anaerolineae bacterium]